LFQNQYFASAPLHRATPYFNQQYTDGLFGALILHSPNDTLKFANGANTNTSLSASTRSVLDADSAEYLSTARRSSSPSAVTNTTYDGDLIFIVGDVYNTFSTVVLQTYLSPNGPDGTQGDEPAADGGLVNGIGRSNCDFAPVGSTCDGGSNYNFTVEAGRRYRMRIINAGSFANIQFSVDGHPLTVIEADATAIEPTQVQSVSFQVAVR
jgi:FtsP/CotA-like multicopper oxidase with cupredoxin domain